MTGQWSVGCRSRSAGGWRGYIAAVASWLSQLCSSAKMKFDASLVASHASVSTLPPPALPEIALIGRSNVGKSSLINALTDRKQLAKTSSTPGKTQLLNYFLVNGAFHLVD